MEVQAPFGAHGIEMEEDRGDWSSDCESTVSDAESRVLLPGCFVARVEDEDEVYDGLSRRFLSLLGDGIRSGTRVVAIHRKIWDDARGDACLHSFLIRRKAVASMNGGHANVKLAWFGTSKQGIERILSHGFGHTEILQDSGLYGTGIYLSPEDSLVESLQSCLPDEDGVRHVLLSRVLLGKVKVVHSHSKLSLSTFEEDFDTGVDNLQHPRRYIIRSTNMNMHILPEYVISFTAPSIAKGWRLNRDKEAFKSPKSPWMSFPSLMLELAKFLPPYSIKLISKHYKDFKEKKISRPEFIRYLRNTTGDRLLAKILISRSQRKLRDPQQLVHQTCERSLIRGVE